MSKFEKIATAAALAASLTAASGEQAEAASGSACKIEMVQPGEASALDRYEIAVQRIAKNPEQFKHELVGTKLAFVRDALRTKRDEDIERVDDAYLTAAVLEDFQDVNKERLAELQQAIDTLEKISAQLEAERANTVGEKNFAKIRKLEEDTVVARSFVDASTRVLANILKNKCVPPTDR